MLLRGLQLGGRLLVRVPGVLHALLRRPQGGTRRGHLLLGFRPNPQSLRFGRGNPRVRLGLQFRVAFRHSFSHRRIVGGERLVERLPAAVHRGLRLGDGLRQRRQLLVGRPLCLRICLFGRQLRPPGRQLCLPGRQLGLPDRQLRPGSNNVVLRPKHTFVVERDPLRQICAQPGFGVHSVSTLAPGRRGLLGLRSATSGVDTRFPAHPMARRPLLR